MITSLHSPHVEAVKALLGSRGGKARKETGSYVVESLQNIREMMTHAPDEIKSIYITTEGHERIGEIPVGNFDLHEVTPEVMKAMSDTVTPQGILAIAAIPKHDLASVISGSGSSGKFIFLWQIQDPGNAGTIIRAADAFGFSGVIFSDNSVDAYSPKVVRSGAGSHWHIPIIEEVGLEQLIKVAADNQSLLFATEANAEKDLLSTARESAHSRSIWIFGNEARGIPDDLDVSRVSIPIAGKAESLNLASAASVVMYAVSAAGK